MPGVYFSPEQKIHLAQEISDFGVDIIDIMPAVSKSEAEVTKKISNMGLTADIGATARLKKEDIELAADCGAQRVTLFTPLSDIHLKYKLKIDRQTNLQRALEYIDFAREHGLTVDFVGEDATRADLDYVVEFINSLRGKIGYFIACDTLGCLTPFQTYDFFRELSSRCNAKIGSHCHNDFGMATANTLAGIKAGVGLFSGTFCGLGERAGNAPIEEVCVALDTFEDANLKVKFNDLTKLCKLVERYSNLKIHPHKPWVGENAFAHEAGVHVHGVIANPKTYENLEPELVGQKRRFVFGKHSGKGALRYALQPHDIKPDEGQLAVLLDRIKELSIERKRALTEEEVLSLARGELG
ncbi:MAG: homoaconitate hydratase [Candidatus Diapherotrites archaeon]|nr:homoaconitate hydratase [Candidatus Diapherotrites archaeon]